MNNSKEVQEMAQLYYNRMHLQANTLIRGAQYISEEDVARLIGDIINEANTLVHLTPPDEVPVSELQSFAKGVAVDKIMTCIKKFKDSDSNKALEIFYAKCSAGLAANDDVRSAVEESLAELSGKDNMFNAMKYAEDVEILTRMLRKS